MSLVELSFDEGNPFADDPSTGTSSTEDPFTSPADDRNNPEDPAESSGGPIYTLELSTSRGLKNALLTAQPISFHGDYPVNDLRRLRDFATGTRTANFNPFHMCDVTHYTRDLKESAPIPATLGCIFGTESSILPMEATMSFEQKISVPTHPKENRSLPKRVKQNYSKFTIGGGGIARLKNSKGKWNLATHQDLTKYAFEHMEGPLAEWLNSEQPDQPARWSCPAIWTKGLGESKPDIHVQHVPRDIPNTWDKPSDHNLLSDWRTDPSQREDASSLVNRVPSIWRATMNISGHLPESSDLQYDLGNVKGQSLPSEINLKLELKLRLRPRLDEEDIDGYVTNIYFDT